MVAWYFAATRDQAQKALDAGKITPKDVQAAINKTGPGLHITSDLDTVSFWAETLGEGARVLVVEIPTRDVLVPDDEDVRSLLYEEWGEHKELEFCVRQYWFDSLNSEREETNLPTYKSLDEAWDEYTEFLDVSDESDASEVEELTKEIVDRYPTLALKIVDVMKKGVYPGTLPVIGSVDVKTKA